MRSPWCCICFQINKSDWLTNLFYKLSGETQHILMSRSIQEQRKIRTAESGFLLPCAEFCALRDFFLIYSKCPYTFSSPQHQNIKHQNCSSKVMCIREVVYFNSLISFFWLQNADFILDIKWQPKTMQPDLCYLVKFCSWHVTQTCPGWHLPKGKFTPRTITVTITIEI